MATKLFVGKLSFDTTNDSLQALFAQYGNVESAVVVTDRETQRSRGFGFVEMTEKSEAIAAIKALDGQTFEGRIIAVNEARPREDRPQNGGGFGGGNNFRNNRR